GRTLNFILINHKAVEQIIKTLFLQISLIRPDEGMSPSIRRKASKKLQVNIFLGERNTKNFKLIDKLLQPLTPPKMYVIAEYFTS
nr:hypothetical protein [Tanacetum cinerariifolium]